MIIGAVTFIISWIVFLFSFNKRKFPLYLPTVYTGVIYALITDLMTFVYPLWKYPGTNIEAFWIQLFNGLGLYFVVIYFFLQTLPKIQTVLSVARHIFYWTIFSITLELLYIYLGFIEHGMWWNMGFSYIADWVLFIIFYLHHKWISSHLLINSNIRA